MRSASRRRRRRRRKKRGARSWLQKKKKKRRVQVCSGHRIRRLKTSFKDDAIVPTVSVLPLSYHWGYLRLPIFVPSLAYDFSLLIRCRLPVERASIGSVQLLAANVVSEDPFVRVDRIISK